MNKSKTLSLVESALLIALSYALSYITLPELPQGGTITVVSMLPLLLVGLRHGPIWGMGSGLVYSVLQLFQKGALGNLLAWTKTPESFVAALFLDYIIAFSVLGLSFLFRKYRKGLLYAVPFCLTLRFLCHFLSGVIVWSDYAGDTAVWLYSLVYNGSYMGVELISTFIVAVVLVHSLPRFFAPQPVSQ